MTATASGPTPAPGPPGAGSTDPSVADPPETDPLDAGRPAGRRGAWIVAGTTLALAAAMVVLVALTTDPAPTDVQAADDGRAGLEACRAGRWPESAFGRPLALAEGSSGLGVWVDLDGWHLELVPGDGAATEQAVEGRLIFVSEPLEVRVLPDGAELGEAVEPVALDFRIDPAEGETGLDFTVPCGYKAIGVELLSGESALDLDDLFVGPEGRASSNPFVIERQ
jgi:hypothetical protein